MGPSLSLWWLIPAQASFNLHLNAAAKADLEAAIRIEPKAPLLHHQLFGVLLAENRLPEAEAELELAGSLDPDGAAVHLGRAELAGRRKDVGGALAEYDEAVRLAPREDFAWQSRGRFRFNQGNFKGAALDLAAAAAAAQGSDAYVLLWLYLARAKLGTNPYPEFAFWSSRIQRTFWPGPLVELYLGLRSMPSALAAAKTDDERCEADFYAAEWLIQQAQGRSAADMLKAAVSICPASYVEYQGARAEGSRLAAASLRSTKPAPLHPAPPVLAKPVIPDAPAVLSGGTCPIATGTAEWRIARGSDVHAPPVLEVHAAIPTAFLEFKLLVTPGLDADPFARDIAVPPAPRGVTVDQPGDLAGRDARFTTPLDVDSFSRVSDGLFFANTQRKAMTSNLAQMLAATALVVPLRVRSKGSCTLSVRIDDAARGALRDAERAWSAGAAGEPR